MCPVTSWRIYEVQRTLNGKVKETFQNDGSTTASRTWRALRRGRETPLTQNECTVTRKSIWIFKNVCISFIKITKPLNLLQTNKARAFLRTNFTKLKFWPRLHLMFNQISCHCLLTPNLFQTCLSFFFLKEVIWKNYGSQDK